MVGRQQSDVGGVKGFGRKTGNAGEQPGGRRAAPAPAGGGVDTRPSNTASKSYGEGYQVRVLRLGIDSLYLSYYGEINPHQDFELSGKKLSAQSRYAKERALAQWEVGDHIFEVSGAGQRVEGQGGFSYVLTDNAFRIALSSASSRALPMAYVRISSEFLAHVGPEAAVEELTEILGAFGESDRFPVVSRVDLYADFQADLDMEGHPRHAWVTRAGSINTYSVRGQFSGYTVGQGGPISCRLYDKSLEILSSKKAFFLELWQRGGMEPERHVWRLEFQVTRQALQQLGIRSFEGLIREQGGVWGYATQSWLRLAVPQSADSNRARWPTHPLWERLAGIRWSTVDVPLSRKFSTARAPSLGRLYRMHAGHIASFMAIQKIDDFATAERAFVEAARGFNESRCRERLEIGFEDWIAMEIGIKRKQYNTGLNVRDPEDGAEDSDEVDRSAIEYQRASRGE